MPIISSKNAEIHYQTFGDATKPALVFSNSLGTNLSMWHSQIKFFKHHYYVVCYDTRGHGESSTPDGPYSINQLSLDVVNLLDHLEIQQCSFCGISMGGLIGQWLTIHYPNRVQKLIICNTAAKIGQEQAWLERAHLVRAQGLDSIASTAAQRWFTDPFIQSNTTIISKLSNDLKAGSPEGYASCCEALANADTRQFIDRIVAPTLIIAGTKDPVTTVNDAIFMQDRIIGSTLYEIDASHISNIEQPALFNQQLSLFLQESNP